MPFHERPVGKEKHRGQVSELRAAAWLLEQGYEVFRNISPFGDVDIVAIKDGVVRLFDVKSGYRGRSKKLGVEHITPMADGSFRIMSGLAKPRTITRELTPREIVLRQLAKSDSLD